MVIKSRIQLFFVLTEKADLQSVTSDGSVDFSPLAVSLKLYKMGPQDILFQIVKIILRVCAVITLSYKAFKPPIPRVPMLLRVKL